MTAFLETLVRQGRCQFLDRVSDWREAVIRSAQPLVADGSVTQDYPRRLVSVIEEYGPYLVFPNQVAIPHAQQGAPEVCRGGAAFLRLKEPVSFPAGPEGEAKTARLFFTLAAREPEEHLATLSALAAILEDQTLLDALMAAEGPEDLLAAGETPQSPSGTAPL